jgi:hypothetical protein
MGRESLRLLRENATKEAFKTGKEMVMVCSKPTKEHTEVSSKITKCTVKESLFLQMATSLPATLKTI